MLDSFYYHFAETEDCHWWHESRRLLAEEFLEKLNINEYDYGLDIGCGTGGNLKVLQKYCRNLIGVDKSDIALKLAKERWQNFNFVKGDANYLYKLFEPEKFGIVTIFNVLYHQWILNEEEVLKQIFKILKPGGYLLITEPAFNFLKRKHDLQVMGKSRYRISFFEKILKKAGFDTVSKTYFNSMSFLPAFLLASVDYFCKTKNKEINKMDTVKEVQIPNIFINNLLLRLMKVERMAVNSIGMIPFGVSLLCVVRKPV